MIFVRKRKRGNINDKNVEDARYIVNLISVAYTMPLIEKLFSNSGKISDMDDIYFALAALVDTDRINEAFHMIRGLFCIADMERPQEFIQLKKSEQIQGK